ncbi:hypothetical protein V6N12_049036 [Hibiscus sabdariffa]|uniref:Uncharacterized protein n=1 Tax=Hibiscus sabdariffa TaxID=183260 RepID=A0ABR2EJD7_9ROSI
MARDLPSSRHLNNHVNRRSQSMDTMSIAKLHNVMSSLLQAFICMRCDVARLSDLPANRNREVWGEMRRVALKNNFGIAMRCSQ